MEDSKRFKRGNEPTMETVGNIFDKVQLTKLLIHTLKELGYDSSAVALQEESGGIQVESTVVQKLFNYIKQGKYEVIDFELLNSLSLRLVNSDSTNNYIHNTDYINKGKSMNINNIISSDLDIPKIVSSFSNQFDVFSNFYSTSVFDTESLNHFRNILEIMILINKHFFIELIYDKKCLPTAVIFIRNTLRKYLALWDSVLTALQTNMVDEDTVFTPEKVLRELSSLLTIPASIKDKNTSELWQGSIVSSRQELIDKISYYINPNDLVPHGRLIELLRQSIKYQRSCDSFNLFDDEIDLDFTPIHLVNLLQDNISDFERINFVEVKTLPSNMDEVWYLEFSPNGKYLAAAIANSITDRKIIIYDVENDFSICKILAGNSQCILYLSFSQDSKYLVTCPFNEHTNIYDIEANGERIELDINGNNHSNDLDDDPMNLTKKTKTVIETEIVGPIDSFLIPPAAAKVHDSSNSRRNSVNETFNMSSPFGGDSQSLSSTADSTNSSHAHNENTLNQNDTSLRVWCCDWFHTEKHSGKLILGSPDRDVIVYDTSSKSIIYRFSQNTKNHIQKGSDFNYRTANGGDSNVIRNALSGNNGNAALDALSEEQFPRIHDLKISYDDNYLLLMTHQGSIDVYNISNLPSNEDLRRTEKNIPSNCYFKMESRLNVGKNITCISLPLNNSKSYERLSSLVLVNLQHNEVQLWDYKNNILIQKYFGQKQEQFIIRSCFGFDNKLVVSGSEDGKIYIWDRVKGNIVGVLSGHTTDRLSSKAGNGSRKFGKNCNVVAWNSNNKFLFASGGDDGLIKIWKVIKN